MATYRAGQRVRIIGATNLPETVGMEAVIIGGPFETRWGLAYPNTVAEEFGYFGTLEQHLSPLLPPDERADQFIERIKRLGKEPINDAPKVTVEK